MKKSISILFVALISQTAIAMQPVNESLYKLIAKEDAESRVNRQVCSLEGYQKLLFEEQLYYALQLHDTASVMKTEEMALQSLIKTTEDFPNEWLGFYWVAHLYGQVGRLFKDNDKFMSYVEYAYQNLKMAEQLNSNPTQEDKSELLVLESLLNRLHAFTFFNPRTGIDIDKEESKRHIDLSLGLLKQAEEAYPYNPRVFLQKGIVSTMDAQYEKAISEFRQSIALFESKDSVSKIYPNWGKVWLATWLPRAEKLLAESRNKY